MEKKLSTNHAAGSYKVIPSNEIKSVKEKPSVNWFKLTGINLLAFGLELCACAGFTYIPPILLKNGFTDKNLTIILGIGPFLSLLFVPVIGRWSDKCQSRFGRRRPFMFALGILMISAMIVIPFNIEIFGRCHNIFHPSLGLAAGVVLLDFSSQALMNPCKSLISDIFHSPEELNSGFTVYSCMLSLGGCCGYFMTSVDWTSMSFGIYFGGQEKAVFSVLATICLFLLGINLSVAKEDPLVEYNPLLTSISVNGSCNDNFYLKSTKYLQAEHKVYFSSNTSKLKNGLKSYSANIIKSKIVRYFTRFEFKIWSWFKSLKVGLKQLFLILLLPIKAIFNCALKDFFQMPPVLFRLFIACLFGWMGIMCHDMYYSDFVGQVIYRGEPHAEKESVAVNLYNQGVRMGSWGLLFHCISAAVYASFIQENLIYQYGTRNVYIFGMFSFSVSLLGTVLTNNMLLINIFAALSGLGYAAITTVPYSLASQYYKEGELYYYENNCRGVGEDMAVLDSAFYLSQIIPSLFLGYLVEYTSSSSTYMIVAAICGFAACCFSYFVTFVPH